MNRLMLIPGLLILSSLSAALPQARAAGGEAGATSGAASSSAATGGSKAAMPTFSGKHSEWKFSDLKLVPVQNGGRIKPLDAFARESVLYMTGKRGYQGWDSTDLVLSWLTYPQYWETQAFVLVNHPDVRRQLGLEDKRTHFSPQELLSNMTLLQYAERVGRPQGAPGSQVGKNEKRQAPREQELQTLLDRLGLFRNIVSGDAWTVIPKASVAAPMGGVSGWQNLSYTGAEAESVRKGFVDVLMAYQSGDETQFAAASRSFRATVQGMVPDWSEKLARVLNAEVFYNSFHPFQWAWILYLTSAVVWLLAGKTRWRRLADAVHAGGLGCLTVGMALRMFITGRPPVSNMYESMIFVCFGVNVFALILYALQKNRQKLILIISSCLITVLLIAADAAPLMMDPNLHPLVPVLRSNYWLTVHVLTITLGYAALALTMGIADVALFNYLKPADSVTTGRIQQLNQLTYRAMQFGVVLLAAGTILGGVWADYSWGRFWGWDPKEVWALIALLSYLVILHGRYTSWINQFAYAAWTVVGFLSVIMAWYGVNFILGAGLHSYGFSSGGQGFVFSFAAVQLAFVAYVWLVHAKKLPSPFMRMVGRANA